MAPAYKHATSVTGQVFFCAAPIRIDSYDGCQFGCLYCFSRRRARRWAGNGVHQANARALKRRFDRVANGQCSSALDEFLAARVPVQLGGLHDPFTPREKHGTVTYEIMRVLAELNYPTLISTKGDLVTNSNYLSLLRDLNVVVRFSAAGVSERFRPQIDRRCSGFDRTLEKIGSLAVHGIKTGLRIQPILPGFEEDALRMLREAALVGVRQVSFEFLKLPKETLRTAVRIMSEVVGFDILEHMKSLGLAEVGWDYSLAPKAKRQFIVAARHACHELGVSFGAGDTEFIPWSDGDGCCGSSSLHLDGATQFRANFVGAIKSALKRPNQDVRFSVLNDMWSPQCPISTYLDSRSRSQKTESTRSDWLMLMAARWNGDLGPYSPAFFDGVKSTSKFDSKGFRIYDAAVLANNLSAGNQVRPAAPVSL